MKRLFNWLAESNRWKHLLGGIMVGLCGLSVYGAIYGSCVAASCLELKDKLYGKKWDWIDWICTVIGGLLSGCAWFIIDQFLI